MTISTVTELQRRAKFYFDCVAAGETVRVVRRGKPIADIVPYQYVAPSWKRRKASPIRIEGASVSQMIIESR